MNSAQHLWQWLSGKKTYFIAVGSAIYAWGIAHQLWTNDPLIDTLLLGGGAAALRHGWKVEAAKIVQAVLISPPVLPALTTTTSLTTVPAPGVAGTPVQVLPPVNGSSPKTGAVQLTTLFALCGALCLGAIPAVMFMSAGCANLAHGADPLIVRTEQAQSSAKPGFDFLLHTEDANRDFWQTNAPGFYDFCEWLRQPQAVTGPTAFGTNISMDLPRASALQWNLDQVKTAYKGGKATSNAVWEVLVTLESALNQTATWTQVVTNSPGN